MPNVSAPLPTSPALSREAATFCREIKCPNMMEAVMGAAPYCRLAFLRMCGKIITGGGCGVPVTVEEPNVHNEALRASFFCLRKEEPVES